MKTSRAYQIEAVKSVVPWLCDNNGNPLIVLPTGTGKSYVMADLIVQFTSDYPGMRIIVATHVADLVEQDYKEFLEMVPMANAGIFSAGLKQRNTYSQILFVGIQSVYDKAFKLQKCDILLIDEAQTIPRDSKTMWGRFIADMLTINPDMRIIGFTATDYRMDSGSLAEGEDRMFHGVAYQYDLLRAVEEGYLCEIVPKDTKTKLNTDGVKKRGGDFIESELQKAVDKDPLNRAIIADIMEKGQDRKTWMIFAAGVEHCQHFRDILREYGVTAEMVVGDTPQAERDDIYKRMKSGELRCAISVKVMTTGTNIPCIDLIADCAPTESAGLLVQKAGRGMRTVYAPGMPLDTVEQRLQAIAMSTKPNCLYLDYAQNLPRHGPLDKIRAKKPGDGDGVPPMKVCPGHEGPPPIYCGSIIFAGFMTCPHCGFKFPEPEAPKIEAKASAVPALSTQRILNEERVTDVRYAEHRKVGKVPTLRVDYYCGLQKYSEWICLEHEAGFAYNKAYSWWRKRSSAPPPKTVAEALQGVKYGDYYLAPVDLLPKPSSITVYQEDGYWRIAGYEFAEPKTESEPEAQPATAGGNPFGWSLDDEIPF